MQSIATHSLRRRPAPGRALRLMTLTGAAAALSACGSLSGFGGGTSLACHLPVGSHCDSVSNTYNDSLHGGLPGQQRDNATPSAPPVSRSGLQGSPQDRDPYLTNVAVTAPAAGNGMPLRTPSRVMRIWVKAWEDSDGDLHDQSFVYIPVDDSRWLVDHQQRQVRDAFAPARTLRSFNATTAEVTPPPPDVPAAVPATVSLTERDAAQKSPVQGARRGY